MAPISTALLLGNVYFAMKFIDGNDQKLTQIFLACWFVSWIGTGIPLCFLGHWAIPTTYYLYPLVLFILAITNGKILESIFGYPSKYIAGNPDEIAFLTFVTTVIAMGWITTSVCFDNSLYFTPGLFLLLAGLFVGTKELRALNISEIVF